MDFAKSFVSRAIGSVGDDLCLPVSDEPAIELQFFRSLGCGSIGMQN